VSATIRRLGFLPTADETLALFHGERIAEFYRTCENKADIRNNITGEKSCYFNVLVIEKLTTIVQLLKIEHFAMP